jgi:intein/homing endonuclease
MDLINYQDFINKDIKTIIKINLSWSLFYPACSTPPWQLEGVMKKLNDDGFSSERIIPVENQTVVTHPWKGAYLNKWLPILSKYDTEYRPLTNENWVNYNPKGDVPAMRELFKDKIIIPEIFKEANVIHLPTIKCVHPDTELFMSDGALVKISSLVEKHHEKEEVHSDSKQDRYTSTRTKIMSYNGKIRSGTTSRLWKTESPNFVYNIETKTGKEIITSENHPFLTPDGWMLSKDLSKGSRIAIPRKLPINGEKQKLPGNKTINERIKNISIEKIEFRDGKKHNSEIQKKIVQEYLTGRTTTQISKELSIHVESIRQILLRYGIPIRWVRPPLRVPKLTSPDFWEWMGYFLAEGYANETRGSMRYWFSNSDEIIRKRFIYLTKSLFNIDIKIRSNSYDMYFDSNEFRDFMAILGFSRTIISGNKSIPRILFKCTNSEIQSFLQAYFDGDGGVAKDGLHIVTKSKRLAKDIVLLLLRIGVIGFLKSVESYATNVLKPKKRKYWQISIYGDEVVNFSNKIVLKMVKKQNDLKNFAKRRSQSKKQTNWDTIPLDRRIFRRIREGLGYTQQSTGKPSSVNAIENGISKPTRHTLNYFIHLFEKNSRGMFKQELEYLKMICSEEIAWDYIEELNKTESNTPYLYDLSVEETNCFIGNGTILHNTHGHTTMTGTMKNAFGGLIPKYRHHSHKVIHEILVDLLTIQKEIHPGLLAVMDGSVAGDGAGPRIMNPVETNILLAGEDQVAMDAVSAKLMGFDPLKIKFIKMAHDQGLGMGDVDQIDIIRMDSDTFRATNFHFKTKRSLVVKWDQRLRKTTYKYRPLKPLHWFLFYTPFFQLFIMASGVYHDWIWYPLVGKKRIKKFVTESEWGRLFDKYEFGEKITKYPEIKNWNRY